MKRDGLSTGLFQDEEDGYNLDEEEKLEETKFKLKIPNSSPEPSGDDLDLGGGEDLDLGGDDEELDLGGEEDLDLGGEEEGGSDDKPFDDEPFDAGVEASEEDDPEKYIQQLAGKLGQSMRDYTEELGEPDFDLEKFAINSVVSASHSAEMDEEDQDDIIEKVKSSGRGEVDSDEESEDEDLDLGDEGGEEDLSLDDEGGEEELDLGDEELNEISPEKSEELGRDIYHHSEFNDGDLSACCGARIIMGDICADCGEHTEPAGEEDLDESLSDKGMEHWATFGKIGEKINSIDDMKELAQTFRYMYDKIESERGRDALIYFFNDRKETLEKNIGNLNISEDENPCWKGYEQVGMKEKDGKQVPNCVPVKENLQEAEYQGKSVTLNKPSRGDVKKFKVYVKNDKGNVVKVNFGDKNMEIKRDNPERRKSFRARHNCSNPGPKWKARYWSCKMWGKSSVSSIVSEDLHKSEKLSIFVKENENNMTETQPLVKPKEKEVEPRPTRETRTWGPKRDTKPNPKFDGGQELITGDE